LRLALGPAAEAEEAFGEQQVDGDRDIDGECPDFEDGDRPRQLVALVGGGGSPRT